MAKPSLKNILSKSTRLDQISLKLPIAPLSPYSTCDPQTTSSEQAFCACSIFQNYQHTESLHSRSFESLVWKLLPDTPPSVHHHCSPSSTPSLVTQLVYSHSLPLSAICAPTTNIFGSSVHFWRRMEHDVESNDVVVCLFTNNSQKNRK